MADGIYEMAGSPTPAEIDGKIYNLGPWLVEDDGAVELAVLAERKRPEEVLPSLLPKFEKEQQRILLEIAYVDWVRGPRASRKEVYDWLQTRRGAIFRLHRLLIRNHSEITLEEATKLHDRALEIVGRAVQESGQPLGNSSAPDQAGATIHPNSPPGEKSSAA